MIALARQPLQPWPIDADGYERMMEAGVFAQAPKVELRDGVVIEMAPQSTEHSAPKSRLGFAVMRALERADGAFEAMIEVSVRLSPGRVVDPDIVVAAAPLAGGFVTARAVRLAIEISRSSLPDDLGWKLGAYAEAAIPEYWVVDLAAQVIRQHWSPRPKSADYAAVALVAFGEPAPARTIDGLSVDTAALLPR